MIGDLTLDNRIIFSKLGVGLTFGDLGIRINVKGKYAKSGRISAATTDATLPVTELSTIGVVGLENINAPLVDTPAAPTVVVVGTPGSTTYTYKVVARQADGGYTVASAAGTVSTGNATLTTSQLNRLTWPAIDNSSRYDVYRTVGGGSTGLISSAFLTSPTLDDTGLTADGSTAPATTPYDFQILFGIDGTSYPIRLRGGDQATLRWNGAAIHFKASFVACDFAYIVVED